MNSCSYNNAKDKIYGVVIMPQPLRVLNFVHFSVIYLLGRPCTVVTGGLIKCS